MYTTLGNNIIYEKDFQIRTTSYLRQSSTHIRQARTHKHTVRQLENFKMFMKFPCVATFLFNIINTIEENQFNTPLEMERDTACITDELAARKQYILFRLQRKIK